MAISSMLRFNVAATAFIGLFSTLGAAAPAIKPSVCPPFSGTFNISSFQLYPENLDFDSCHCKLYLGADFNASVLVYDPYTKTQETITFPGITHNATFHVSGVDFDARTGAMYFSANSAAPFLTFGGDLTGPNFLIKYDTNTKKVVYTADMNSVTSGIEAATGITVNGFQDMAEDTKGNSYFIMTFGNAIAKVGPTGQVSTFYSTPAADMQPSKMGFGGLVSVGDTLVVGDNIAGAFVTFDTTKSNATAFTTKISGFPSGYTFSCDGVLAPSRYHETIILCSDDGTESIAVYQSADKWASAKFLGSVPNNDPLIIGFGLPTATVQIADSIYISNEYFNDTGAELAAAGDRSLFPFIDITAKVDALIV